MPINNGIDAAKLATEGVKPPVSMIFGSQFVNPWLIVKDNKPIIRTILTFRICIRPVNILIILPVCLASVDLISLARNHHNIAVIKAGRLASRKVSRQLYPVRGMITLFVSEKAANPPVAIAAI